MSPSSVDSHLSLLRRQLAEELVAAVITALKHVARGVVEASWAHVDLLGGELGAVHGTVLHGHVPLHGGIGGLEAETGLRVMLGKVRPEGGQVLHFPAGLVDLLGLLDDVLLA